LPRSGIATYTINTSGDLYVADYGNSRVLEFDRPLQTDVIADSFNTFAPGTSATW
jgi:hypothetical protein